MENGAIVDHEANLKDRCIVPGKCPCRTVNSARKRQTLHCLIAGLSEKETAAAIGISVNTVHQNVRDIYCHFQVNSRAELLSRILLMLLHDIAGRPRRHCGPAWRSRDAAVVTG